MTEAPHLTEDGTSPLYLAAMAGSAQMVRAMLRPSPDGTPSPASSSGPMGRTALHVAATFSSGTFVHKYRFDSAVFLILQAASVLNFDRFLHP
jgi:ankyrin repeat protein